MVDEATAAPSSRAKSKSISESPFVFPKFFGKLDFPSEFRDLAEKNTLQAKENYDKLKSATEEVTGGFKDAYEAATKGTRDYGVRLIQAGRTNVNAAFDYAVELLSAKSLSEAIELSTAQLRKQFETLAEQSKELASLAQKIATETAEPIREGVNKAFKQAA
jgi:phasin